MNISLKAAAPVEFRLSETGDVSVAFSRLGVVDLDRDVTFPGALPAGKAVPMSAYGHTSWDGAPPVGKGVISERDSLGVFDGAFFMDTEAGREAHATVKAMGELQQWSYGYVVIDGGPGEFDGQKVRELRKLDVFEVSPVLVGAGIGTGTLAIKGGVPGPGTPYAEHLSWHVDGLSALIDRTRDRQAFREAEGRKLSRTDRARLEDLESALVAHLEAVRSLLVDPKAAERRRAEFEVLLSRARVLGVDI